MGDKVGTCEGEAVGMGVGWPGRYVGDNVGDKVGTCEGEAVGMGVGWPGRYDGDNVGEDVGYEKIDTYN